MSKLTPAMRKQIISDWKHGIQNSDYRVIERDDGTFQVRKRDSKFKAFIQKQEPEPVPQPEPEPKKEEPDRLTNEELLRKLSRLLEVPENPPEKTPQEFEQEQEAYEEDQNYIERMASSNFNPYIRRPLRLY